MCELMNYISEKYKEKSNKELKKEEKISNNKKVQYFTNQNAINYLNQYLHSTKSEANCPYICNLSIL